MTQSSWSCTSRAPLHWYLYYLVCLSPANVILVQYSYLGYRKDNRIDGLPAGQELLMSMICFAQFVLLGTFAAILSAHRSDILEKSEDDNTGGVVPAAGTYEAPNVHTE